MVISERDVYSSRFETCKLHDMMREICLLKAEEENFLQTVQGTSTKSKSPCKFRKLAVHWPDETFNVETEVKNPSLRNLLFIKSERWKATSLFFTRHKLMRVLDLSYVQFEGRKVPSSIGKLIHLRYLSLKWAKVTHLPSSMRNLKKLLYLNLNVNPYQVYMPNILKEMRELICLHFPSKIKNKVKMELGNLVKLEILENLSTEHGNVSDLKDMTQLKTLSINNIGDQGCTREALSSSLIKLTCLEKLTIRDYKNPTNDDEDIFVLNSIHLRQLKLDIYKPRLPDEKDFLSYLTTIDLEQCCLEEDPMPILGKLPRLKQVTFRQKALCSKIMVCLRGEFPQLQKLEIRGLEELEEWRVEDGSMPLLNSLSIEGCDKFEEWTVGKCSMPLLSTLRISCCEKLKELRDRLQFITSVKDLKITFKNIQCMRLSEEQLPSHLTTISLARCCLEEDPMPILEKLLHLKEISLEEITFSGRRMVCSSGGFPQLQTLKIEKLKELEEWIVEDRSMPLLHSLSIWNCKKLEELKVEQGSMPLLHSLSISFCEKLKELRDRLRFITSVKDLSVSFSNIQCMRLSEEQLPSQLTTIRLYKCHLEEDPMPILEKLPHLENISLNDSSFCGSRMVCSRGGFPKLQKLKLQGLKELEELIVEEGSMPLLHSLSISCEKLEEWVVEESSMALLHTLDIIFCAKLKRLPDRLRFINSLENVKFRGMGKKWKKRLSEGGEDYYKVQHIPSVKFF